jgi:magnesium transporter
MEPKPNEHPEREEPFELDAAPDADELEAMLEQGDPATIRRFLRTLHPADLALLFDRVDEDLWPRLVANLATGELSDLMEELDDHLRDDLAALLKRDQLVRVLGEMDSDDAADVLADLPDAMARDLLRGMSRDDRREVESLLRYPEDTAGGIMQVELVSVREDATVDQAIEAIRANTEEVQAVHFVFMVDARERLTGLLPLDQLLLAKPDTRVSEVARRDFWTVRPETDQEEVALMFKRYDLVSMAVVDADDTLLGRITYDDVIDVLEEEIEEDILRMEGLEEPELVYSNRVIKIATVRLPWLLATMAGTLISGFIVQQFTLSFPELLALVSFVPVIAAMGGNIGSQSSTIVVRGFATGRIDFSNLGRFLLREMVIGALIGLCCGLVVGAVAYAWHGQTMLGLAVSLSLLLAIAFSAVMGVLVPFFFRLLRVDPAIAAGPLVTTGNDILGLVVYYGISIALLR